MLLPVPCLVLDGGPLGTCWWWQQADSPCCSGYTKLALHIVPAVRVHCAESKLLDAILPCLDLPEPDSCCCVYWPRAWHPGVCNKLIPPVLPLCPANVPGAERRVALPASPLVCIDPPLLNLPPPLHINCSTMSPWRASARRGSGQQGRTRCSSPRQPACTWSRHKPPAPPPPLPLPPHSRQEPSLRCAAKGMHCWRLPHGHCQ